MPITFTCRCGESLTVDAAMKDRRVFCPKCRSSVEIPERPEPASAPAGGGTKGDAFYEGEILQPRRVERLSDADGERWKLTCFCGKRNLSPLHSEYPVGRCPKCGRRMRLPGYRPKSVRNKAPAAAVGAAATGRPIPPTPGLDETIADLPVLTPQNLKLGSPEGGGASAGAGTAVAPPSSSQDRKGLESLAQSTAAAEPRYDAEDEIGTIIMEPLELQAIPRETGVSRSAAIGTADRLRAHKITVPESSDPGLISAWPLAGPVSRALAGFIDLTFAMLAAGAVVALATLRFLPPACAHPSVGVAAFFAAGIVNDIFLELSGGGVGKRLVVLTLRTRGGQALDAAEAIRRALLKWALIPGWILFLFDPAQRALHDMLCGTLVLKARSR